MEIYQLKVFLEVARHLSFTEAADVLNLTQPAVSAKIKSLEQGLGTDLFHRLGRKIKLTTVGDYLLERGPSLLELEGLLVKEIEEIKQGKFSHLNIGCTVNVANGWLPKILFEYRQRYPEIEVRCFPFDSVHQLHQAMTLGNVDIGFAETDLNGFAEIDSVAVDSFQYCLIVAADHRLANQPWLSLKNLTSEAWVFPAAATPERLALESRMTELGMQLSDFTHHEVVQSASLMSTFLSQGHYLGFASSLQFQTERKAQILKAVPLQEFSLNVKLFRLQLKRDLKNTPPQKAISKGPLQRLIQLIDKRTGYGSSPPSTAVASNLKIPVYLNAPGPSIHRPSVPEQLTISIGTQHKTIQTVTAGVIIQQLGLLEHFLPHDGHYSNTEYNIQWRDFTSGAPIVSGLQSDDLDIGILGDYPLLLSGMSPVEDAQSVAKDKLVKTRLAKTRLAKTRLAKTRLAKTRLAKTRLVSFVASNPDGAGNTVIVPNRSQLTSLDDFRSRVIAVPFASAAHGMIMRSLSQANLLAEVTLTSIDNLSIHRLTPRDNQADGYAYFAPLHDIASHKGQFRRLLAGDLLGDSAQQLPTFHGVVVREAFADEHPDLVSAYLKALIAAQYWYETTPSALSLVSRWVGLDAQIVSKTLSDYRSEAAGLFFPDTTIRTDWVEEHVRQLSKISGNEALSDIDLSTWIQPELLDAALASL